MKPNVCERCGLIGRTHPTQEQCLRALKQRVDALEERQDGMYRSATFYALRYGELERTHKQTTEERDHAVAQEEDTSRTFGELLDKLWGLVYPAEPQSWEYPGQVLNHIRQYIEEHKAKITELEALIPADVRLAADEAWAIEALRAISQSGRGLPIEVACKLKEVVARRESAPAREEQL